MSPDCNDNEDAKVWFNCVEEMVFTDDSLCSETLVADADDHPVRCSVAASRRKLQALQAAYIVCLYQNWEGVDSSKRRIRRYRFGTVVSVSTLPSPDAAMAWSYWWSAHVQVARDIGLSTAKHANYHDIPDHEFSWQEYAAREELIR